MPNFRWYGMLLPNRKFLTNGGHLNPGLSKTKFMDFKVGGRRFYAMVSPEGQERWSIQKYTSITSKNQFQNV